MEKILTFIMNKKKELLLLKGSPNDPQFHRSFWYVVTGAREKCDNTLEDAVIREVKEETNLNVKKMKYLNWIFKYNSLGKECIEYVYISLVDCGNIILNEEHIDYKWCNVNEFIQMIEWYGDKEELQNVIRYATNEELFFRTEHIIIS